MAKTDDFFDNLVFDHENNTVSHKPNSPYAKRSKELDWFDKNPLPEDHPLKQRPQEGKVAPVPGVVGHGSAMALGAGAGVVDAFATLAVPPVAAYKLLSSAVPDVSDTRPKEEGMRQLQQAFDAGALQAMDADEVAAYFRNLKAMYGEEKILDPEVRKEIEGYSEFLSGVKNPIRAIAKGIGKAFGLPMDTSAVEYAYDMGEFATFAGGAKAAAGAAGKMIAKSAAVGAGVGAATKAVTDVAQAMGLPPWLAGLMGMGVAVAHGGVQYLKERNVVRAANRAANAARHFATDVANLEGIASEAAGRADTYAQNLMQQFPRETRVGMGQAVRVQGLIDETEAIANRAIVAGASEAAETITEVTSSLRKSAIRTPEQQQSAVARVAGRMRLTGQAGTEQAERTANVMTRTISAERQRLSDRFTRRYDGFWRKYGDQTIELTPNQVEPLRQAVQLARDTLQSPDKGIQVALTTVQAQEWKAFIDWLGKLGPDNQFYRFSARELNDLMQLVNRKLYPYVAGRDTNVWFVAKGILRDHMRNALGPEAYRKLQVYNTEYGQFKQLFDENSAIQNVMYSGTEYTKVLEAGKNPVVAKLLSELSPSDARMVGQYYANDMYINEKAFARRFQDSGDYMSHYLTNRVFKRYARELAPFDLNILPSEMSKARESLLRQRQRFAGTPGETYLDEAIDAVSVAGKGPSQAAVERYTNEQVLFQLRAAQDAKSIVSEVQNLRNLLDDYMKTGSWDSVRAGFEAAKTLGLGFTQRYSDAVLESMIARFQGRQQRYSAAAVVKDNAELMQELFGAAQAKTRVLAAEAAPLLLANFEEANLVWQNMSPKMKASIAEKLADPTIPLPKRTKAQAIVDFFEGNFSKLTQKSVNDIETEIIQRAANDPKFAVALAKLNKFDVSPETVETVQALLLAGLFR